MPDSVLASSSEITEAVPPTALAARRRHPDHIRIKPNRQRSSPSQNFIVGRPVPGLILCRGPTAHAAQLSRWSHEMNPSADLCINKASLGGQICAKPSIVSWSDTIHRSFFRLLPNCGGIRRAVSTPRIRWAAEIESEGCG